MNGMLLLGGEEVRALLDGREHEVIDAVERAYRAHAAGASSLPHSVFLRFPHHPGSRIIALPAYVGGGLDVAGLKWIASFPHNLEAGIERASATLILNSVETGRPHAIMEASVVSARRTAASAALAARHLHAGHDASRLGVVGCGPISLEVVRFVRAALPELRELVLFDLAPERVERFAAVARREVGPLEVTRAASTDEVLESAELVAFATTAPAPYVRRLPPASRARTILHVSLRDLAPEILLAADNVVDDVDHVCRASTSPHLAEQAAGNRDFIRCTLADVFDGRAPARVGDGRVSIFSPFGLGVLDLAVAQLVYARGMEDGVGTRLHGFFPAPWDAAGAPGA
ncbi:MAG TPA: 2,3-diaminopropionate biosynthesis protein SbnB [Longimicrobium sp.]|nr:2,3-diaminopropionate biosynthesis protein SbnB [Longimicrobium sp.]